ncbi:hypothetical protein SAMN07250955_10658 [Arboricoccus pini]|uniref:Uncharacterized protein n=1 Tax=Arboricoccus pini TaxID=1963835 RepID=A0A212R747_9PROT|nr:hypothetical protein [Arboricoccus pini]SNB67810.1 hypothetical protein SAMN07250955_10658 [Arboricoccus pini]
MDEYTPEQRATLAALIARSRDLEADTRYYRALFDEQIQASKPKRTPLERLMEHADPTTGVLWVNEHNQARRTGEDVSRLFFEATGMSPNECRDGGGVVFEPTLTQTREAARQGRSTPYLSRMHAIYYRVRIEPKEVSQ